MENLGPLFGDEKRPFSSLEDWEFKYANTQDSTHGLHPYPARMIPQIASKLMDMYLSNIKNPIIVDVFCGSGTVNVEASLRGYKSLGIDLNPFAVLLSEAKTTNFGNPQEITNIRSKFINKLGLYQKTFVQEIPSYNNLTHWFKADVINKLSYIKHHIKLIKSSGLRNLLYIAFANTLMKSSNVDWKSSRYIRTYPKEKLEQWHPNVFYEFERSLIDLDSRVKSFIKKRNGIAQIIRADARRLPLKDNFADIIITSPPYGEERNTIPYIRWSKLFLLWMDITEEDIIKSYKQALGGNQKIQIQKDDILSETFWESVKDIPSERIKEVLPFMTDYLITIKEMKRILKRNRRCCIVIGHRSIKRKLLDMGKITAELAEYAGFKLEDTYRRRIPKKMIPWSTPTGKTIFDESIVVLKKIR